MGGGEINSEHIVTPKHAKSGCTRFSKMDRHGVAKRRLEVRLGKCGRDIATLATVCHAILATCSCGVRRYESIDRASKRAQSS